MIYLGEFSFVVNGCESDDAFEEHIDQVLDFLHEDARVIDPDYATNLTGRRVEYSLSVEAADEEAAFPLLHGALRAAIHAAEGCTPGWENAFTQERMSLRRSELVEA